MPFKLENLAVVPQVIQPVSWLFSTDLEDAYFHVPMHESSRPHLCFRWRDKVYTTNVLPFGLNLAPWVFTKGIGNESPKLTTIGFGGYKRKNRN